MAADDCGMVGRSLLLAWDVPPDQEEPWRRFLQELSASANHEEEYAHSRRALGIKAQSVWLAPKPSGGGVAIVYLQAENPEWVLGELAESDAPFDSCYGAQMRRFSGMDPARFERVAPGELLFAWHDGDPGEHQAAKKDSAERER